MYRKGSGTQLAVIEESLPETERDIETVKRVLATQVAGSEDLKAFLRIQDLTEDFIRRLRPLFLVSVGKSSEDHLKDAKVIDEGLLFLAELEPPLLTFKTANAAMHIAGSVQALRKSFQDLRRLLEQKDEQHKIKRKQLLG